MSTKDVSADRARQLFDYSAETGNLIWKAGPRAGKVAGCLRSDGYVFVKVDRVMLGAHRIAWVHYYGTPLVGECDHKDRNRSNNAIDNLRDATPTQNRANSKIKLNNKTGFKGVCFDKRAGKYRADIRRKGAKRMLGYFDDALLASAAYSAAALAAHGEFVGQAEKKLKSRGSSPQLTAE